MPNKHEMRKGYYENMRKWKQQYEINQKKEENKKSGIILSEAAINGIQGVKEVEMNDTLEYRRLVEEADERIEESRVRARRVAKRASQEGPYWRKIKKGV